MQLSIFYAVESHTFHISFNLNQKLSATLSVTDGGSSITLMYIKLLHQRRNLRMFSLFLFGIHLKEKKKFGY